MLGKEIGHAKNVSDSRRRAVKFRLWSLERARVKFCVKFFGCKILGVKFRVKFGVKFQA